MQNETLLKVALDGWGGQGNLGSSQGAATSSCVSPLGLAIHSRVLIALCTSFLRRLG